MSNRGRQILVYFLGSILLAESPITQSQTDTTPQESDNFGEFSFDDEFFELSFDDNSKQNEYSWKDDFTVRVSQLLFGQINNHQVEPIPGYKYLKKSAVENNRTGVNVRYQSAFAPGWLVQASWQGRLYWKEDYEYEENNDSVGDEYRINELFLQASFDKHSLKLGRQTIVWGETVGNSVLDVINHNEYRDFTIIDTEDTRLNQWMLVWDTFGTSGNWSTFINLYPEFNPKPIKGGPFEFDLSYRPGKLERGDRPLFEAGTKWQKSWEATDLAIMAAYLYENQLRYKSQMFLGETVDAIKNDFLLLGLSVNRATGKLLFNLDIVLNHGLLIDNSTFVGSGILGGVSADLKRDQLGASFGIEYGINNYQNISISIRAKKMINERKGLTDKDVLINEGVYGSWLMRYTNRVSNDDIELSATLQGDLKGAAVLMMLGSTYAVNDNWKVGLQALSIYANSSSELNFFKDDIRLGATVTYSF